MRRVRSNVLTSKVCVCVRACGWTYRLQTMEGGTVAHPVSLTGPHTNTKAEPRILLPHTGGVAARLGALRCIVHCCELLQRLRGPIFLFATSFFFFFFAQGSPACCLHQVIDKFPSVGHSVTPFIWLSVRWEKHVLLCRITNLQ